VSFRVRDNGIGIAPESAPYIFDMFAQLKPALERSEGGLGIGLALAKGLIDLHGGQITVSSEGLGRGSEFVVSLPLHNIVPAQIAVDAGQGPGACNDPCDIIIADDNADALQSLAMLLELEGHQVRTAADGAAALAHLHERMPDVMLLDIGMPGMNGYEVARKVREARGAVTLIALTGWGQPNDRQRAREAGFDHHLTKPVEFVELEKLLKKTRSSTQQRPPLRAVNT
jgi:CheY-like chemotaxis protein